ncbi:hypothetical protein HO133_000868 [Letharia lupina]|uniref:Altered inheritance of mitochondria protein 11 n=1 Tax=Letharia lupina TaxID=560253 RepID=A0A8H6CG86_9LECA|nr:uncharacterized protein HO133_000868 [Letharia lupina]KAF6222818.1 hypothetical protein HO133_000868 [Letharia lupina]
MALLQRPPLPPMSSPETPRPPSSSTRTRNQLNIFLTGAALLTLSSLLTRRSLHLRRRSIIPRFYHPSNQHPSLKIDGRLEAYQALGIATVNVASFFTMAGGGLLWAFDIGSVEDIGRRVGGGRGGGGKWRGRGERGEDEEEFEKWVASLTGRQTAEERRWSARGPEEEERAREEGYAVVEPRGMNERGKPR